MMTNYDDEIIIVIMVDFVAVTSVKAFLTVVHLDFFLLNKFDLL